jgi:hypothetical protein
MSHSLSKAHADLGRVLAALDREGPVIDAFIRDDDAGRGDHELMALLDVTMQAEVPIDLATIPCDLSAGLVNELLGRMNDAPSLLGVHQHGYAHKSHEVDGRRCEFGASRSAAQQRGDLVEGRLRLREAFSTQVDAIFTPPWNRCTADTAAVLQELGFQMLSRDRSARPTTTMRELPVDVDWTRAWREDGEERLAQTFANALRAREADGQPLGLMLHHEVMSHEERCCLGTWLSALGKHPRLHWRLMKDLVGTQP